MLKTEKTDSNSALGHLVAWTKKSDEKLDEIREGLARLLEQLAVREGKAALPHAKMSKPKDKAPLALFKPGAEVLVYFQNDDDWQEGVVIDNTQAPKAYQVRLEAGNEVVTAHEIFITAALDDERLVAIERGELLAAAKKQNTPTIAEGDDVAVTTKRGKGRALSEKSLAKRAAYAEAVARLLAGIPYDEETLARMRRQDLAKLAKALGGAGDDMVVPNPKLQALILRLQPNYVK